MSVFVSSLAIVTVQAVAADPPVSSAPAQSAKAKDMQAQVEAVLGAADASTSRPGRAGRPAAAGAAPAPATAAPGAADTRSLDEDTQTAEEGCRRPEPRPVRAGGGTAVPGQHPGGRVRIDGCGEFFALDSVTLKIDNKEVTNYLYTPREVDALLKGGVQRLYLGNLKVGNHELVAFFSGKGPDNRDYRRGASLKFDKSIGAKYLELKIEDRQRKMQPEFEIKDWE